MISRIWEKRIQATADEETASTIKNASVILTPTTRIKETLISVKFEKDQVIFFLPGIFF
jgi:hypothetical protein